MILVFRSGFASNLYLGDLIFDRSYVNFASCNGWSLFGVVGLIGLIRSVIRRRGFGVCYLLAGVVRLFQEVGGKKIGGVGVRSTVREKFWRYYN